VPFSAAAIIIVALTGGCASSGGGGSCPFMHPEKAMIESARAADAAFVADFNKGDVDATASHYWNSPDVVLYPPGEMECHGWQQARDALAHVFKQMPGAQLKLIDPQYQVAGKDVIGYGRWTLTPPNGQPLEGRYTQVMAKKDGKWVMILDHPSVPMK
jgi:ketosteroid isomerase-like protein